MVEDDDDSIDIVTFDTVLKDTPGGPLKARVEVPLRPIPRPIPHVEDGPKKIVLTEENMDFPMGDDTGGEPTEDDRVHVNKVRADEHMNVNTS